MSNWKYWFICIFRNHEKRWFKATHTGHDMSWQCKRCGYYEHYAFCRANPVLMDYGQSEDVQT